MRVPQYGFFFISLFSLLLLQLSTAISVAGSRGVKTIRFGGKVPEVHRRILHQPLLPAISSPPASESPPSTPENADVPDHPFFPEVPSTPYERQSPSFPPPPVSAAINGGLPILSGTQTAEPGKKVAIAVSVGIVTLGMLSALAFFLYRHKVRHAIEAQKLVNGCGNGGSHGFQEDPRTPISSLLYIGTVEPSRDSASQSNGGINEAVNASPYRKLNSVKGSDRYRPSPELQPLPPLSRQPASMNSPSALSPSLSYSSSDGYTLHGSTISSYDGYYKPFARSVYSNSHSVSHSKRTSPGSRVATGGATIRAAASPSPEMQHAFIPAIKQKSPLQPPLLMLSGKSQRQLQAVNQEKPSLKGQYPPPPPPPPPPRAPPPPPPPPPPPLQRQPTDFQTHCKISNADETCPSTSNESRKKQDFLTPSPESNHMVEINSKPGGSSGKTGDGDIELGRPKLKPLHWDKVHARSDRATVWDQIKLNSFQLNEGMMEHLFGCESTNLAPKEAARRSAIPPVENEQRVLDPKKSMNISILLRALNVTREEVAEALLDGNLGSLGVELLETMVKMAPTNEEEIKLREYSGDFSKLGISEQFLKTILDVPFAFKRVISMLYRANFEAEVKYLRNSFHTLEVASKELKNSRLFLKLLEAVLRAGNRMNVGTNRGDAQAFRLDTLLKLVDVKGVDGKTTLLHFVVQEITRSEGVSEKEEDFKKQGLQVVSGLSGDLASVKMAAGMDFDVLSSYVFKLETGLDKVRSILQREKEETQQGKFFDSVKTFLNTAEEEMLRVKRDEGRILTLVKEVTEYFHGDAVKEEAHPLRIFMVVRDFLGILDNVCKEVKTMHSSTVMGSAGSFRIYS